MTTVEQPKVDDVTPEQQQEQDDAALRAGYEKASGKPDTEAGALVAVEPEPGEIKPDVAVTEVDPWEGVNPAVKDMLQGISERMGDVDKLGQRFKSFEGRLGAVQNALAAGKAAAATTGTDAPTQQQITTAAQNTVKWKQLSEDFPEWAEAVDERLAAQAAEFAKHPASSVDVEGMKQEFSQSLAEVRQASTQEARQLAQVDIKHPGWEDTVKTPDYAAWIKTQAPDIQALGDSDRAADAIKLLDIYAENRKAIEKQAKNQTRLATVVAPRLANTTGSTVLPDEAGLSVGYKRIKQA